MKNPVKKAINTIVAISFLFSLIVLKGVYNEHKAHELAMASEGTDIAICISMQTYGFMQDGDCFRETEFWEVVISGLLY